MIGMTPSWDSFSAETQAVSDGLYLPVMEGCLADFLANDGNFSPISDLILPDVVQSPACTGALIVHENQAVETTQIYYVCILWIFLTHEPISMSTGVNFHIGHKQA
jgi:hypothetical protein